MTPATKLPFIATGDEATDHAAFEEYVGGIPRAFRLLYCYKNSCAGVHHGWFPDTTKEENFRSRALRAGFDNMDVDAFLAIQ